MIYVYYYRDDVDNELGFLTEDKNMLSILKIVVPIYLILWWLPMLFEENDDFGGDDDDDNEIDDDELVKAKIIP